MRIKKNDQLIKVGHCGGAEGIRHLSYSFLYAWTISSSIKDVGRSCWLLRRLNFSSSLCTFRWCTICLDQDCRCHYAVRVPWVHPIFLTRHCYQGGPKIKPLSKKYQKGFLHVYQVLSLTRKISDIVYRDKYRRSLFPMIRLTGSNLQLVSIFLRSTEPSLIISIL